MFSKSNSSVIFSDYPNLLANYLNLGEEMISFEMEGEAVTQIANAFEDTLSPNFYQRATATLSVVKESDLCKEFINQYKKTSILTGNALITLENGESFKMNKLKIEMNIGSLNGSSSTIEVKLFGNVKTNQALLV